MTRVPDTLGFRLTIWYALAVCLFLVGAFTLLYLGLDRVLQARMDEDLREDITELSLLYREEGMTGLETELRREAASGGDQEIYRLLGQDGRVLFISGPDIWTELESAETFPPSPDTAAPGFLSSVQLPDEEAPRRIISDRIAPDRILQIGESLDEQQEMLAVLRSVFLLSLLLVIPLAAATGWLLSRRAVQGLRAVAGTATRIARGDLDSRVIVTGQDAEIRTLADTFNLMLDRIQSLITSMREMTDNIAHDLRSPLARIRVISEMALTDSKSGEEYQASAAQTIEECDRLLQMINTTLDVAEAEADTGKFPQEEVDISGLTEDACELFQEVAEERGIELRCQVQAGCRIRGNTNNLQRMLANLMDNALKYTPAPGQVKVELHCADRNLTINISDSGIGIPEPEQTRIFERFFRVDQSRSQEGCGLGLSFARAVARAHGGDITVSSVPREGSSFTISLST